MAPEFFVGVAKQLLIFSATVIIILVIG